MIKHVHLSFFLCLSLILGRNVYADDLASKIDWPAFMAKQDMVWNRPPDKWASGAFLGNGLLGANVFTTEDGKSLMWRIGRTDVVLKGERIPIGEMVLKTVGTLQGGYFHLDLWNAELTCSIKTSSGEIHIRSFTHAQQLVQVIEIHPDAGEAACRWEWRPDEPIDPRKIYLKEPITEEDKSPAAQFSDVAAVHACVQPLRGAGEHATAWAETANRVLYLSVGFSKKKGEAKTQAVDALTVAESTGLDSLVESHRQWWHHYWPESFLSIPDSRLESFYWIQMYKLASATRPDRPAIDLMGPWFNNTPWPKIWWNLNIELTYWPVLTSNRLELGESLCKMIDDGKEALAANTRTFASDSYAIGRSCSYDCVRPVSHEICDLPWALHNYYLQYRYTMDDAMLRDRLFPLLKGSINYYLHLLKPGGDGYLHITDGFSPEYPGQPAPNPDCNIDLALLRWGCQTLLDTCDRLKVEDPLIPTWKRTLQKLLPYPADENGFKISASMPVAVSHRHYSHLLMIYPLHTLDLDVSANRELAMKSFDHWTSLSQQFRGFSYTGAASISSVLGNGNDSLKYLNKLLDTKILPNTMYVEAGPVIETPLSAAASIHDMLLSSWGGKIHVFPAVPDAWQDIAFDKLRTEGAFLVSAVRKDGKTQFIRIESLAGEPCRVVTDMLNPAAAGIAIHKVAATEYDLDLKKGQSILLTSGGANVDAEIAPVHAGQKERENYYGLH